MSINIFVKFDSPLKYLLIITSSGILCPPSETLVAMAANGQVLPMVGNFIFVHLAWNRCLAFL